MKHRLATTIAFALAAVPLTALAQEQAPAPTVVIQAPVVIHVTAPVAPAAAPAPVLDAETPPVAAPVTYAPPPPAPAPSPASASEPPSENVRLRFGIAGSVLVGAANSDSVHVMALNPGLSLDLGVQLNDRSAFYLRGELGTLLFFNSAAAYAVGEWTPHRLISLGTGLGIDGMALLGYAASVNCVPGSVCTSPRTSWSGISVPLLVSFNFGRQVAPETRRNVFRLGLEAAVGVEPSSGTVGWHTAINVGYTMM